MIEIQMPQDILKYKTKAIGNFSAREAIAAGIGAFVAIGAYATVLSGISDIIVRAIVAALIATPIFLFGFCRPMDLNLEQALVIIIRDNLIAPPKRKYELVYPAYETYRKCVGDSGLKHTSVDAAVETARAEAGNKASKKKASGKQDKPQLVSSMKVKASKTYKAIR